MSRKEKGLKWNGSKYVYQVFNHHFKIIQIFYTALGVFFSKY